MLITISKAKAAIKDGINSYLKKDSNGEYQMKEVNCLPFYLEGAPGIGKTEIVKQIADEMKLGFVSFSLVHHTRNSLLGLPVIRELDNGEKFTSYTMSEVIAKVFEEVSAGHEEGILLLDEFPCMSESVMPAMLAFLQTKNIGTHRLPRGWVIVLCGNPSQYNKTAKSFDAAVTDRIRKLSIEYSYSDFCEYAKEHHFNEMVLSYLEQHQDHMYRFIKNKDKEELVTCRGWENLSCAINLYEELNQFIDAVCVKQFIKSEEIATSFSEFYRQQTCGMTEIERKRIFDGKISDDVVEKYAGISFGEKWNIAAYLMGYLDNTASLVAKTTAILSGAKRVIDAISKELDDDSNDDYWSVMNAMNASIDYVQQNETWFNSMSREGILNDWKSLWCLKELDLSDEVFIEIIVAIGNALRIHNTKIHNSSDEAFISYGKEHIKTLRSWKKDYEKKVKKSIEEGGKKIDALFEFLSRIDDTDALGERLYVEISGNKDLLWMACDSNSKNYEEMCKKQFGVSQIS